MIATAEEELNKLKACVMVSPKMICKSLSSLGVFYGCMEELLQMPRTQQVFSHSQEKKWVEEELDASLRLVELCDIMRDTLTVTIEHAQELEMVLRRKRNMNTGYKAQLSHIQSAKKTNKSIKSCLKALKKIDGKDSDTSTVCKMLNEAREVTISLLQSVAFSLSPSSAQKTSKWSIVSKALHKKKRVVKAQDELAAMLSSLEGLEMELESLYKKLIQNRVSLLNLLGQ
ncbi:Myc-type basic helix-loop-helix (bHLH) domain-containing protein [Dioscorea alata]|uniref:Myc-type basic helix-loop-helix (BHLH) domain-containing protein n=1 Tax=Dioscorea alata TaxID=55571 RepID=A0ACB7V6X6_DIOAL|nr:Myc-type basic helix-loop-helix (bHLH) domain-containing protein [Dioscorea alata]